MLSIGDAPTSERPILAKRRQSERSGATRQRTIVNIQLLRGLSALAVILVHLTGPDGVLPIPRVGQGGVDIFFVISGFLMVEISRGCQLDARTFMTQRLARIAPFYWLMTLCVFLVALAAPHLLAATTPSAADLLRSLLFIPFKKANGLIQPTLFVGWSLNYEMFFYACFALGLSMRRASLGYAVTAVLLLVCVGFGLLVPGEGTLYRFYTSPVSLEFLAGMSIAGLCGSERRPLSSPRRWSLLALGLMAFPLLLILPVACPGPTLLLCGLPAAAIVWVAVRLEQAGWRLQMKEFLLLGDASFALYLTHPFVLQAVRGIAGRLHVPLQAGGLTFTAALLAAVAFGIVSHKLVERPLSRLASRIVAGRRSTRFLSRESGAVMQESRP